MEFYQGSFEEVPAGTGDWAITLGTFDGVHRGHVAIVQECRSQVRAKGLVGTCAVSFAMHPRSILVGKRAPRILSSLEEKTTLLREAGVDKLVILDFDASLASLAYDTFVRELLSKRLGLAHFVLGHDVHFGRDRGGNLQTVAALAEADGFGMSQVASIRHDGEPISSTRIRDLISSGEIEHATKLLGHAPILPATVVEGQRIGRTLGFPTANLEGLVGARLLPASGVYSGWLQVEGGASWLGCVLNIGVRPTVESAGALTVEAHVLDGSHELYGRRVALALQGRIRPEQRFATLDELREQIAADTLSARHKLDGLSPLAVAALQVV